MKIAQIVPIWYNIPPDKYGGLEGVAYNITEGLVKKGHEVTIFATENSRTKAKIISIVKQGLWSESITFVDKSRCIANIANAYEHASEFDIIHNHDNFNDGYFALPFSKIVDTPTVHTIHGGVFINREAEIFYKKYRHENFISISDAFREKYLTYLNYVATVYNGIDLKEFNFSEKKGRYLIWLGRVCHSKGTREAIEVAKKSGEKLVIAAKVDQEDKDYFEKYIKKEIDNKKISFLGEVGPTLRADLLRNAKAILVPINWDEPFGLVMPEAMACGTPVIAFRRGSVPEVVKDGETGFIIEPEDIDGMVEAVKKVDQIDRKKCRQWVEKNFTVEKMVDGYEKVYQRLIHPVK